MLCLKNDGYEPTLQVGKAYRVLRPERGDPPYTLRVVDEEAEDYLYDSDWFVPLVLPKKAHRALAARI